MILFLFLSISIVYSSAVEMALSIKEDEIDYEEKAVFDLSLRGKALSGRVHIEPRSAISFNMNYEKGEKLSNLFRFWSSYFFPEEGGFSSLGYALTYKIGGRALYLRASLGAQVALNYSKYTELTTLTLYQLYQLEASLRASYAGFTITGGNLNGLEEDLKNPFSLALSLDFYPSEKIEVRLMSMVTLSEVLMDPYYVLYAKRIRLSLSYEV